MYVQGIYYVYVLALLALCQASAAQSIPGVTVEGIPGKPGQADSIHNKQDQVQHFRSKLDSSVNRSIPPKKGLRPEFHGYARVFGQYANANYPFQAGPSSYIGYEFVPQLKWGNITFDIPVQYSTQQRSVGYQLNRISIRFDRQAFVRGMQQKAKERLQHENRWKDSLRYMMEQQMRELPGTKGLKDSLEQRIRNAKDSLPGTDSLQIDTSDLTRLRQQYDSVQQCVARMEAIWDQYQKLKEMQFFDPAQMINKYKPGTQMPQNGLSRAERLFATVQQFQVGTINPVYNSLYLQGVSISGLNVEIQAGLYYAAAIAGRLSQPLTFNVLRPKMEYRWLYGARAGIGSKEGTHLHFSYLSSKDKHTDNSIGNAGVDILNPQQNKVATADIRLNLNSKWWLSAEYGVSASNEMPVSKDSLSNEESSALPSNHFSFSNTTHHAWKTGITGELKNARLTAGVQRTGSYYFTVGNPYLRRDLMRYDIRWQQKLYKNIVRWDAQGQLDHDNLNQQKAYTTNYQYLTNSIDLRPKRWPAFRLMHAYRAQQSRGIERYQNRVNLYSVTGTYQKRFKLYHQLSWMAGYNYQRQKDDAGSVSTTNYLMAGQTYYYKDWFDFQYNGTIIFSGTADTLTQADGRRGTMNSHQASSHIRYGKGWSSGAGGNYTHDPVWGKISGVFIQQQGPLWKNAGFDIQAGLNHYSKRDDGQPSQQMTLNVQLTQRW